MMGSGVLVMLFWTLLVYLLPQSFWGEHKLKSLFLMTAILIMAEVTVSMLSGFLQARQQSGWLSIYRVCERYLILAATVYTLYFVSQSLEGVFTARIISQFLIIGVLAWFVLKDTPLIPNKTSPRMLKEMMFYGIPLLGNELVSIILSLGDRYLIQWQIGSESLGAYAAAYNLCEYVRMMLVISLFQAIRPMYFKLWTEQGPDETRAFVERSLYFYLMICFPVIAGVTAIAPDLLTLLTSGKYTEGVAVIPYIIAGLMIYGIHVMVGAGIFINKSSVLMWLTLIAATINIIANYFLIPIYGITGAGMATLLSYVLLTLMEALAGRKSLAIKFPFLAAGKFAGLSLIMYWVLSQIHVDNTLVKMLLQILAGTLLYTCMILIADSNARKIVLARLKNTA